MINYPDISKFTKKQWIIGIIVTATAITSAYFAVRYVNLIKAYTKVVSQSEAESLIQNPNMPLVELPDKELDNWIAAQSQVGTPQDAVQLTETNGRAVSTYILVGDATTSVYTKISGLTNADGSVAIQPYETYNGHTDTALKADATVVKIDPINVVYGTYDAASNTFTPDKP